jgi:ketosteroid isomerase-like protein
MRPRLYSFVIALLLLLPGPSFAHPVEDANAVVDRWAATFTANDADALVKLYAPDAILFGTVSPIIADNPDLFVTISNGCPAAATK